MSSDSLMKRNSWIVVAVGTLFDIAFCFVVALIFSPRQPGSGFLILLATVWGVGLLWGGASFGFRCRCCVVT